MANTLGDVWEVVWSGTLHGQTINTVRHYSIVNMGGSTSTAGAAPTAIAIARGLDPQTETYRNLCSNEYHLNFLKVQRMRPLPRLFALVDTVRSNDGGQVFDSLPTSVCAVIRLQTEFAGRAYRGRIFMPAVPKSFENDSKLLQGAVDNYQVLGNLMATPVIATPTTTSGDMGLVPVLYHRASNTVTPVSRAMVDRILRVQRRREVGKGV